MKGCILLIAVPLAAFITVYSFDAGCLFCISDPIIREEYQSYVNVASIAIGLITLGLLVYLIARKRSKVE